jgi:hypothetical protein
VEKCCDVVVPVVVDFVVRCGNQQWCWLVWLQIWDIDFFSWFEFVRRSVEVGGPSSKSGVKIIADHKDGRCTRVLKNHSN